MPVHSLEIKQRMDTILTARYSDLELEWKCCEDLVRLAKREQDFYAIAFAHIYMGDYYISYNNVKCQRHFLKAQKICLENGFIDLQMKIFHLMGIYYNMIYDDQSAIQAFLDGLVLAHKLGDFLEESILLNNIGDTLRLYMDYQEAFSYFTKSLERMMDKDAKKDCRLSVSLYFNLAEVSLKLGNLEKMRGYLELCEQIKVSDQTEEDIKHVYDTEASFKQLGLMAGWCAYYAAIGDCVRSAEFAGKILKSAVLETVNKYIVFEFLHIVFDALLSGGVEKEAEQILEILGQLSSFNGLSGIQRYVSMKVCFAERFRSDEARKQACCEFYETMRSNERMVSESRAKGLKSKISLFEAKSEQEHLREESIQYEKEAHLDELTGVFNRRYFNKLCSKMNSADFDMDTAIIMIDVDYFKEYNDFYGHTMGDEVLRAVACALQSCQDENITVSRYGGDEFICLCTDMNKCEIEAYIEQIRTYLHLLHLPHEKSPCGSEVTISIGYCSELAAVELQQKWADEALYRSKAKGRNCWSGTDPGGG